MTVFQDSFRERYRRLSDAELLDLVEQAAGERLDALAARHLFAPTGAAHLDVHYDEGILVGYRWFDQNGLEPLFPFGHGLSYTTFGYNNLRVTPERGDGKKVTVTVAVTNTGSVSGKEVAELYVSFPVEAGEPPRQLKGFEKVALEPGQSKNVTFELDGRAFSYWKDSAGWTIAKGAYQISVGTSSRDTPLTGPFTMQ